MRKAQGVEYHAGMSGTGGAAAVSYGNLHIPVTAVNIEQSGINVVKVAL